MIVARSSAVLAAIRWLSWSSVTAVPPAVTTPMVSISQMFSRSGSAALMLVMVAAWASFSAKTARAAELASIHSTCSADEVSYTGTVIAPTVQMA